ncbi:hypothetical protein MRX96_013961 [Rhipicephalus microplus]
MAIRHKPTRDKSRSQLTGPDWLPGSSATVRPRATERTSSRNSENHVTVDVYGRCGNLQCPQSEECFAHLGEKYYFYLSLENALCPDYVTEKLYNALSHGMVPVVMGAYSSSLAPPGSCIDALQFASPQRLAAYLRDLAADPARYEAILRLEEDARGTKDIVEWWHGDKSTCRQWKPPAS